MTVALVTTLLPTIARRGGLEPIGLAALAAAPFVANLLGAFAGRVGPRSPRQLALIRAAGAASLLVLVFFSVAPVLIAVTFVFWLSLALSGPFYLRLWGSMYPARIRGRVVGFLGSGRAAAAALAALAGGILADQLGGVTAVALAGLVGLVLRVRVRRPSRAERRAPPTLLRPRFDPRAARPAGPVADRRRPGLLRRRPHRGGAAVRDRQRRPPEPVAVGRRDHRHPDRRRDHVFVPRLGRGRGPARAARRDAAREHASGSPPSSPTRWHPTSRVLWVAAVAAGAGSASIDVGIAAVVSDHTPLASRAAAMAGWNAITGARGIVAAFTMSILLQLGLVDVTTGLLLCAAVSAIGVVMYVRASTDRAPTGPQRRARRAERGRR